MPVFRSPHVQRAADTVRRWPPWAWWTLGATLAFALLLLALGGPLSNRVLPQARVQQLLEQAEVALAEGRLSDAQGDGARELFEAALAIDPDRAESRAGLARVALAALIQVDARLRADDLEGARQALALAHSLAAPREPFEVMARRLRERENTHADADSLLAAARRAHAKGRLDGAEDAALPLYRRVLEQQPARIEALEGREDALGELLQQARQRLALGRPDQAAALAAQVRRYDAGHVDLPQTEAELARAIDRTRRDAAQALRRQHLDLAESAFRLLLAVDAQDADARHGLDEVAQAHLAVARREAGEFRFDRAETALAAAQRIAPSLPELAASRRHLQQARQLQARNAPAAGNPRLRLQRLLAEADAARARGDLLTPPGDSAFDKLRAARALAPDDAGVRRAGERLAPAARQCFESELPRNNLARAGNCLDAWIALDGDSAATAQARRRLAQRWLAVGEERLGGGDLAGAAAALDAARKLDSAVPGSADLQRRLRIARGNASG